MSVNESAGRSAPQFTGRGSVVATSPPTNSAAALMTNADGSPSGRATSRGCPELAWGVPICS